MRATTPKTITIQGNIIPRDTLIATYTPEQRGRSLTPAILLLEWAGGDLFFVGREAKDRKTQLLEARVQVDIIFQKEVSRRV